MGKRKERREGGMGVRGRGKKRWEGKGCLPFLVPLACKLKKKRNSMALNHGQSTGICSSELFPVHTTQCLVDPES